MPWISSRDPQIVRWPNQRFHWRCWILLYKWSQTVLICFGRIAQLLSFAWSLISDQPEWWTTILAILLTRIIQNSEYFSDCDDADMRTQDCSQVVCTRACSTKQVFRWFILNLILIFDPDAWSWSWCLILIQLWWCRHKSSGLFTGGLHYSLLTAQAGSCFWLVAHFDPFWSLRKSSTAHVGNISFLDW